MEKIGFDGKDSIVLRTGTAERERHRITRRNALIGTACAGTRWMLDRLVSSSFGVIGVKVWDRIYSPIPISIRGVSQSDGIVELIGRPAMIEGGIEMESTTRQLPRITI